MALVPFDGQLDTAPQAPQQPPAPVRFMQEPSAIDNLLAKLPADIGGTALARVIRGAADPGIALTQIGAHLVGQGDAADKRVADLEQNYQSARASQGSTGFDPLRMVGNVGTALLVPGSVAAQGASMPARLGQAAGIGAAFGAAEPVTDGGDFWNEKAAQVGTGAVLGPAGIPATSAVARVVQPNTSAAARTLMDEGVNLTPGQILGGALKRVEDAATSIPVLGDFIKDAQRRSVADLNRAAYGRALAPIGGDASSLPVGPEGVMAVKTALGDAYDKLLPTLQFKADPQFVQGLSVVRNGANLPPQELATYDALLKKNLGQIQNGVANGDTFKAIESSLTNDAKKFSSSTDAYQKQLGDALTETVNVFRQGLQRSNPQAAQELQAINQGYANYARVRTAAASAGDKSSGFSPAQLAAAVRSSDKSAGKGATATGTALMQDLSDAGRSVLPTSVPDSGAPFRHAIEAGIAGLAGHSVLPEQATGWMLPLAGMAGAASLPYTRMGQKVAQKILAERPDGAAQLAALLRQSGPAIGASATPLLTQGP